MHMQYIAGTKLFCPRQERDKTVFSPVLSHYFFGVRTLRSPPSTQPSLPTLLSVAINTAIVCHQHPRRHRPRRRYHCRYCCRFLVDCCMWNPPLPLICLTRRSMTSSPTLSFAATTATMTAISDAKAATF